MNRNRRLSPITVYNKLYEHFGPQGWWPTTREGKISPTYHSLSYHRPDENEKYEICVGAILTQNTSWKNVEKALVNLHNANIFSAKEVCRLPVKMLAQLIRPSGYYNQKAERLKSFSLYLQNNYKGKCSGLLLKETDAAREELLSLKGIGPETADSILLYAGSHKTFVVDAYTRRIGKRLGWFSSDEYEEIRQMFHSAVPASVEVYNEYHALIVALAKDFCRKEPDCNGCPLILDCATGIRSSKKNS